MDNRRLFELDPVSPVNYIILGISQMVAGELDSALSAFQKHALFEGDDMATKFLSVYALAWKGEYDSAFKLIDELVELGLDNQMYINLKEWCLFFRYALNGEKENALAAITEDVKSFFWTDPDIVWFGVCNYSLIDEKDEALKWVEHMIDKGWINYPFLNERAPFFENIRGDERFKKLMRKIKDKWENFEV